MADVESFTLDHTAVLAPYVRLIGTESGPRGDVISNFDLRLVQPNEQEIPTGGLHTIEHLLASLVRDRIDGLIDITPFGCRTGFHVIMWGEPDVEALVGAITDSLRAIAEDVTWDDVPGTDADPESSTTLLIDIEGFDKGSSFVLTGPGIATTQALAVQGLPDSFADQWATNHASFPRGVDVLLASPAALVGLPRTTRIAAAAELEN